MTTKNMDETMNPFTIYVGFFIEVIKEKFVNKRTKGMARCSCMRDDQECIADRLPPTA